MGINALFLCYPVAILSIVVHQKNQRHEKNQLQESTSCVWLCVAFWFWVCLWKIKRERCRLPMFVGWVKQFQFPNSDPCVVPTTLSPIISALFWVSVVLTLFHPSFPYLPLLLRVGFARAPKRVAVAVTTTSSTMNPLWIGIGINGADISLKLNRPRAFPLFSRYPPLLLCLVCLFYFYIWVITHSEEFSLDI